MLQENEDNESVDASYQRQLAAVAAGAKPSSSLLKTLRRIDALGDASLSQDLRSALARRSINSQQDGCRSEDAWRADEDAWARMINDEANVRRVVPPFALLQLHPYMRRKVLAFLICASQDHALRAIAARAPERPDATRCLTPSPKPSSTVEVFSSNRCTSTSLYGTAPRSTAASVSTLFHHTAALRVVCRELRTDAMALASVATSTATPRSWLANLYCRRDTTLDDAAVVSELRARVVSGRRANMVRELFLRKDACSNFTPPEYGRTSRHDNFAQSQFSRRPESHGRISASRVMCTSAPSRWSERRYDTMRLLVLNGSLEENAASAAFASTRYLTVDEANRNAPVDEELLQALSHTAIKSALTSFRGARVTLVAQSVSLAWWGPQFEGGSQSPPSDCYPRLEEQLDQFFGDRSGDGWIRRWTNKSRQCYDDFLGCTNQLLAEFWHDSSQPPITALEDLMANDTDSIGNMDLTKPAFTAKIDVEFADDAEPSLVEDGWGIRSFSYTLGASSMKAQAGTLAKLGCMIKVDCDDGAIDSVELFINFLAEEELADGYFMARVRARVPGFD
jgi:hypothetical protein